MYNTKLRDISMRRACEKVRLHYSPQYITTVHNVPYIAEYFV